MIISGIAGCIRAQPATREPTDDVGRCLGEDFPATSPRLENSGCSGVAVNGWVSEQDGVYGIVAGRPDWLQADLADAQLKVGPAAALIRAYRQLGDGFLAVLGGRFATCIWDSKQRVGIVARDRFGQVPLYWACNADGDLLFAPTSTAIARLLGKVPSLSAQGIFNYFYFHMVPSPGTIFDDVNKLVASHALIGRDGIWQTRRYWVPEFREEVDRSFDDATREMMGLLSSSVSALSSGADTGAFLSGGLDSSTVAGLLAKHQPASKTYSIGFDAQGYDEIAYARLASEHFGTEFHPYYVTPEDVIEELPGIAAAYDEPFGNSSALPAFFCARLAAEDGRQRLLAGDGGDEIFAGNERYAKQTVFERYALLPGWSRHYVLEPLLFRVVRSQLRGFSKARSYVEQANTPLPDRLQAYNFINRLGVRNIITDELFDAIDVELPKELDRQLYALPGRATRLNRMLFLDWHHTLADNDLRKVTRMSELAGIEVEYPMLDDRLVEFSTRVSSSRKMRGNRLRDFYKRATADFLPRAIIGKPKHGFGLPFGVWMEQHPGLQQLAGDNLARMRRRAYIRPDFIDEIQRLHREQHAGYYGEFIWAAMMLELWLTAQGIEP